MAYFLETSRHPLKYVRLSLWEIIFNSVKLYTHVTAKSLGGSLFWSRYNDAAWGIFVIFWKVNNTLRIKGGSRILQGRVSNPSERGIKGAETETPKALRG